MDPARSRVPWIGRSGTCRLASEWAHLLRQPRPRAAHRPPHRLPARGVAGSGGAVRYVLGLAGVLLSGELVGGIGIPCLNRLDGRGIENLYVIGMDELLAKDAAFFHDNFAGSLTKRVLSFASRFEDFTDNLVFNIIGSLVPLAFASVVLCRYDPFLLPRLLVLIPITAAA